MELTQSTKIRRTLSSLQIALFVGVAILALVTEAVVLKAYFTSGSATQAVEDRSFVTTGLANIQREALLLYIETGRTLRGPDLDQDVVTLRRALLANQLRLQSIKVAGNSEATGRLDEIVATLGKYDAMMQERLEAVIPASAAEIAEFDVVLSDLELQIKTLYDDEELSFFKALSNTLRSNQTLQTFLLALSALVLISGGVLGISLRRTVGALRDEMLERDRVEAHLLDANQQLVDAQDQLVKTTKLAAVGQMSGGVAHDLRNPLGSIKNAAYLLNKKLASEGAIDSNPKLGQYIGIINQQIDRSNRIITDLMTFARVGPPILTEIYVDKVLEESLETMVKNDNLTLSKQVHPDLCPVMGDSEQLQRVFLNLANNAQEAMPDGGQLTISAKGVNNHVEITFSDTGEGISEENIGNIFDPLFTTKTKGTGLGLAVCHEIISRHGGTISARRNEEPSAGTTFEVILPAADARRHTEGEPTYGQ